MVVVHCSRSSCWHWRRPQPQAVDAANDRPHCGITGKPLGVVDVLVAGEPPEYRLPKQPGQRVARVLAASAFEELRDRDVGEPEGIVEFTVGEQAAVGSDPGAVKFELDPAIEMGLRGGSLASPVAYPTIPFLDPSQDQDSSSKIPLKRH
jgi:hypothetical protein